MQLNEIQRDFLARRTYKHKIGVPSEPQYTSDAQRNAVAELVKEGIVRLLDRYKHPEYLILIDVYLVTTKGTKLIEEQNIEAINPGTPETDYPQEPA